MLDYFAHINYVIFEVRLSRSNSGLIGVEDILYSYTKIESPLHSSSFNFFLTYVGDVVRCSGDHYACAPSKIVFARRCGGSHRDAIRLLSS